MRVKHIKTYHQYDDLIRDFGVRRLAKALKMDKAEVSRILTNRRVVDVALMLKIDDIISPDEKNSKLGGKE